MLIQENASLSKLTTMQTGGSARFILTCKNRDDIREAVNFAHEKNLPWFVFGGGSNIIAGDNFAGVVILNHIKKIDQIDDAIYKIGAGENWDEIVAKLCELNLSGIECMSLIPGVAGAIPVQNVGAYGQEISQTLVELTAFDTQENSFKILSHDDCKFSYRNSIFKKRDNRRYIICDITLKLNRANLQPPFYEVLQKYLDENNIKNYSPKSLRDAVIKIRQSKLPNIAEIPSAGSFFKNPVVDKKTADKLTQKYPEIPHWKMPNNCVKFSAGWLIDQSGLKSYANHNFQIYPKNALVVTNISGGNATDLDKFKNEIIAKVHEKFGIKLEQEPENL